MTNRFSARGAGDTLRALASDSGVGEGGFSINGLCKTLRALASNSSVGEGGFSINGLSEVSSPKSIV